jgi:hypothetical protein
VADKYSGYALYDLENDQNEQNNLINAAGYEDVKRDLSRILIKHMNKAGESAPLIAP